MAGAAEGLSEPGDHPSQQVVLSYQADILDRPLQDTLSWMDAGHEVLRAKATPFVSVHANPIDAAERNWLSARLPQAEIRVWPVPHHFPHVTEPDRLAELLTQMASARVRM